MLDGNVSTYVCKNTLDSSFFNRCFLEHPPGPIHVISDTVQPFINPRALATIAVMVVVALPLVCSTTKSVRLSPAAYCSLKLSALNFLYRTAYSCALDVALYAVFQQRRPCACSVDGGGFEQVGSTYGMPSGDSMMGGLFGAWLWDAAQGHWVGRLIGVATILCAMAERVSWGMHSVGQASVGAGLGVLLYCWNTRTPQLMPLLETILFLPTGLILLLSDPARREWAVGAATHPGFENNLLAWWFWGVGLQLLAVILLCRHFTSLGILSRSRLSLATTLQALSPADESPRSSADNTKSPLLEADGRGGETCGHFSELNEGFAPELMLDVNFTLWTAAGCLLVHVLSACEEQFAWISSLGL